LCGSLYKIPASPARGVYNLAQAVLLALHAIAFPPAAPASPVRQKAQKSERNISVSAGDLAGLEEEFRRVLLHLGYRPTGLPHDRMTRILSRFRSQMRRACADADDVRLWRAVFARIR
jgi:tRNA C32,U32 (ribose-2'-O)-methylase TrmJ